MAATSSEPQLLGWPNPPAGYAGQGRATSKALCASNLELHRSALMRYAKRALRNAADAEDAVQDTLMAAVQAPDSFAGRSSLTSWLHGILKHKIMDIFRRESRESALDEDPEREWLVDDHALFTPDGSWRESPSSWGNPEAALARRDFFQVLENCIACLPERAARVFKMREIMELKVDEICDVLGITPNHCFVTLHRARMKLRALLDERWFSLQTAARNETCQVSGRYPGSLREQANG
jgi:RNA polymerase sigma-70 factor (ECF subfamily)